MKVFLSWSGELSRELAEALREWLPAVLQSVKPFFTPNDIEKGARWNKDIAQELASASVGIFCLTKENLTKPWIMFEAGALSKSVDSSRVCPVLFGVDNADLEGPLVQFQAAPFSESEMRKLIKMINSNLGDQKLDDAVLTNVFDMWWPKLNERINSILKRHDTKSDDTPSTRSERDLLEEILQLARLNTSASTKLSRSSRVDSGAMTYALKQIVELIKMINGIAGPAERPALIKGVGEIFSPIRYVIERNTNLADKDPEIADLIEEIDGTVTKNLRS